MALVDALGNRVRFLRLPGQAHHLKGVAPLIRDIPSGALLADTAFDADRLLAGLNDRGATAGIPPKSARKVQRDLDEHVCRWRHFVENHCARIKESRGMAPRYDKTDSSHAATWTRIAAAIASR